MNALHLDTIHILSEHKNTKTFFRALCGRDLWERDCPKYFPCSSVESLDPPPQIACLLVPLSLIDKPVVNLLMI